MITKNKLKNQVITGIKTVKSVYIGDASDKNIGFRNKRAAGEIMNLKQWQIKTEKDLNKLKSNHKISESKKRRLLRRYVAAHTKMHPKHEAEFYKSRNDKLTSGILRAGDAAGIAAWPALALAPIDGGMTAGILKSTSYGAMAAGIGIRNLKKHHLDRRYEYMKKKGYV